MEVAAFVEAHGDLTGEAGHRRIVRHGYLPEREIQTGIGPVAVRCLRLRDRGAVEAGPAIRFSSAILPRYLRVRLEMNCEKSIRYKNRPARPRALTPTAFTQRPLIRHPGPPGTKCPGAESPLGLSGCEPCDPGSIRRRRPGMWLPDSSVRQRPPGTSSRGFGQTGFRDDDLCESCRAQTRGLPVHAARLGRVRPRPSLIDRRDGQQAPRLRRIAGPARRFANHRCIIVSPHGYRHATPIC
jgi:hypothetical protein